VGSGDDVERLKAVARDAGVSGHVKFWGRVADVAPFYRECDIFVMINRRVFEDGMEKTEGFGLVFLEASLFAKPVIAGRCGGAVDAVVDGETGLLVDPGSTAEVAAAILALLTCPVEAKRLGAAGRERVLREFTVKTQVAEFEAAVAGRIREARR
jgi:phosphatidylinositol alpha-1,6-mannosyltransferase